MDIDILNEFLVMSGTDTFVAAAKKLGCSPAALRARISSFEDSLGIKLLQRGAHGYELTEAGRRLIPDAKRITDKYQSYVSKGRATSYEEYHSLTIAFTGLDMPRPLLSRLALFCGKYPNVHIRLMSDTEYPVREGLLSQDVDLYLIYTDRDPFIEGLSAVPLWQAKPFIVVPDSLYISSPSALLKDFDGGSFILYPHTQLTHLREWQKNVLEDSGISYSIYRQDCSREYSSYLLSLGKGQMVYPAADMERLPPKTHALPLTDPHIRKLMAYGMYFKESQNPNLHLFLDDAGLGSWEAVP